MSNQSTRAQGPDPDPRRPFTLTFDQAKELAGIAIPCAGPHAPDRQDRLNDFWQRMGIEHGFVWTTLGQLGGNLYDYEAEPITFTAWPTPMPITPDPDADAYVARMTEHHQAESLGEPFEWDSTDVAAAFVAGRDHGFAMGSATAQANRPGVGWDGMELIRECAGMLRGYEQHHRDSAQEHDRYGPTDSGAESRAKAERNATMADKLEAFLADPSQSHLVHDGLREARQDGETAALAGWHAAMVAVRELVQSGRAQAGSAIPPLVLLDRLGEIEVPDDMDELFNPWRGLGEAFTRLAELRGPRPDFMPEATWNNLSHLNWAIQAAMVGKEFLERTAWVQELVSLGIPEKLGMKPQWGKHRADTLRELVGQLNKLLAQAVAGQLAGLHVQAAADVLQAMGITRKRCTCPDGGGIEVDCPTHDAAEPAATVRTIEEAVRDGLIPGLSQEDLDAIRLARDTDANGPHGDEEPQPVPGVYSPDQGKPEGEA